MMVVEAPWARGESLCEAREVGASLFPCSVRKAWGVFSPKSGLDNRWRLWYKYFCSNRQVHPERLWRRPVVGSSDPGRKGRPLGSFTRLSKNTPTSHLESHSCKNKGLKVPCSHTLTKNIRGEGVPQAEPVLSAVEGARVPRATRHGPQVITRHTILAVAPAPQFSHTINPPTAQ